MLEGKVALVTGAGRGIGATIAETLAREGAFVVVNYRGSGQAAQELAEKIGGVAMQCDVADFEACENMIKTDDRDVWASRYFSQQRRNHKGRSADEDERGGF